MSIPEFTKTLGGAEVKIYERGVGKQRDIHGAYTDGQGNWYPIAWDKNGQFKPYDKDGKYNKKIRTQLDLVESLPNVEQPVPQDPYDPPEVA